MPLIRFFPLFSFLALFVLAGCGGKSIEGGETQPPPAQRNAPRAGGVPVSPDTPATAPRSGGMPIPTTASSVKVQPGWAALMERLRKDSMDNAVVSAYFAGLPEYSPTPMSVKIKELYKIAFLPKPPRDPNAPPPSTIYKGIVTKANVERCKEFMVENAAALQSMHTLYGLPKEVITALLFVETRLGTYLGNDQAFWSLACMAAADAPAKVSRGITDLDIGPAREPWLQSKLTEKSNWAYKELKAMMQFCSTQALDPRGMPGSVYGAIGICQFMPSNLTAYGVDGDGDGRVDLFQPADAIHSAANYLSSHGWKDGLAVDGRRNVIKRYNNSTRYANTILALAESIRTGVLLSGPPTE